MLCGCCCSCSCCASLRDRVQPWLRDYGRLQHLAVIFIYIQIGCALIGSLGALYNGVLLINLAIALFALVAIESSSQSLARTYAVLLLCAVLLDISWFTLFSYEIWNISSADYGFYFIFSIKLTLAMQIVGCCFRVSSSFLWIQMYRLGVDTTTSPDFDLRNSFLNPVTVTPPALVTQCSHDTDDVLGGSIYDPPYYSSLFEDTTNSFGGRNSADNGSTSDAQSPQLKVSVGRSFQAIDEENASIKPPTV